MVHNAKEIISIVFLISVIVPISITMLSNNSIDCYEKIYDIQNGADWTTYSDLSNSNTIMDGMYVNQSIVLNRIINKIDIHVTNHSNTESSIFQVGIYDFSSNTTLVVFGNFSNNQVNGLTTITFYNLFNIRQSQQDDLIGIKLIESSGTSNIQSMTGDNIYANTGVAQITFDGQRNMNENFDYAITLYELKDNCETVNNIIIFIPILGLVVLILIILYKAISDRD